MVKKKRTANANMDYGKEVTLRTIEQWREWAEECADAALDEAASEQEFRQHELVFSQR